MKEEESIYDCLWICVNEKCKARNSNWSDDPKDKWICPFCGWNHWKSEREKEKK